MPQRATGPLGSGTPASHITCLLSKQATRFVHWSPTSSRSSLPYTARNTYWHFHRCREMSLADPQVRCVHFSAFYTATGRLCQSSHHYMTQVVFVKPPVAGCPLLSSLHLLANSKTQAKGLVCYSTVCLMLVPVAARLQWGKQREKLLHEPWDVRAILGMRNHKTIGGGAGEVEVGLGSWRTTITNQRSWKTWHGWRCWHLQANVRIQDHLGSQSGAVKRGTWEKVCEKLLTLGSQHLCGPTCKHLVVGLGHCWSSEPGVGKKCWMQSGREWGQVGTHWAHLHLSIAVADHKSAFRE